MPRITFFLLIGLFGIITNVGAADKDAPDDLAGLQGEWRMVSGTSNGFGIPEGMARNFKRVCQSNELTVTNGTELVMKAKITLDPTKNPKTIDYEVIDGQSKGKTHLGIYELNGDTLKSCFAAPGDKRPTAFASQFGDNRTMSVWKREKKN